MATQDGSLLPIPLNDLLSFKKRVIEVYLKSLSYAPIEDSKRIASMNPDMQALVKQMLSGQRKEQTVEILKSYERICGGITLLTEPVSMVANVVATGLALGPYISGLYAKASGLTTLKEKNAANKLLVSEQPEFQHKMETEAAISTFSAAYYIVSELSAYHTEEVRARVMPHIGLPEFTLMNPQKATACVLFHYGVYLGSQDIVPDEISLVRFTIDYFQLVLDEIGLRKASLKYAEEFENRSYKLEDSSFVIHGFSQEMHDRVQSVDFKRITFDQIVGNRDIKHASKRLIAALLSYSPKEEKNPMVELGGFRPITMGSGPPGTGKSLLISAVATELNDRCKDLDIPFLYWPFPPNPVSEYQGGSSQRVLDWFKPLKDTGKIIYAPVDDAENNLINRGNRSVSSGAREVISIFLTETEGASAIIRGNWAIQLMTNRPEDIDPAVLSRIQGRARIEGAVTWQDFIDQNRLWWKKYEEISSGFVNISRPADYVYFDNQKELKSLSELKAFTGELLPENETVLAIYTTLKKKYDPNREDKFFGLFFEGVKQKFPFITSRDQRNIEMAISERIMDFDFPEDWWKNHDLYFTKSSAEKKGMLIELMKASMKGLSFGELRLQEAVRYLDTTISIYQTNFEQSVLERMEEYAITKEAERRLTKQNT